LKINYTNIKITADLQFLCQFSLKDRYLAGQKIPSFYGLENSLLFMEVFNCATPIALSSSYCTPEYLSLKAILVAAIWFDS
jgi:hypothetical protein